MVRSSSRAATSGKQRPKRAPDLNLRHEGALVRSAEAALVDARGSRTIASPLPNSRPPRGIALGPSTAVPADYASGAGGLGSCMAIGIVGLYVGLPARSPGGPGKARHVASAWAEGGPLAEEAMDGQHSSPVSSPSTVNRGLERRGREPELENERPQVSLAPAACCIDRPHGR
jgi:hypothetical protein